MAKKKERKPISEEQREAARARMAHARANNPDNNPALRAQIPTNPRPTEGKIGKDNPEAPQVGLSPYLAAYLASGESILDFKRLRRESPKDALVLAMERVWGGKGAGKGKKPQQIGILVKVLTGSQPIPDRDSLPQDIVVEVKSDPDTESESQQNQ